MEKDNINEIKDSVEEALDVRNKAASATAEEAKAMEEELISKISNMKEERPYSKRGLKIFIVILVILIILIILRAVQLQLTKQNFKPEEAQLTNVAVQTVERGSIRITSPLASRIEAENTYQVTPAASGTVTSVNVTQGSFVAAGQILFTIDSTQAQLSYNSAELQYKNAQSAYDTSNTSVQTANVSLDQAKKALERTQKLYDAGTVSKSELEQSENAVENAESAVKQAMSARVQAENGINSAKVGVSQAADGLKNYTVTAPSSGYVANVNVKVGDQASQGQSAIVISDTSVLALKANVSEYLISSVKRGQKVEVSVKSASDKPFTGTVTSIGEVPTEGKTTYPVKIHVDDPGKVLRSGMFAEIQLIAKNKDNVIIVPSGSILTREGKKCVYILKDKKTKRVNVTVGLDNGTIAEVTEGLSVGDRLVVKGQNYVEEDTKVNIVNESEDKKEK